MATPGTTLPDFDALWNYGEPAATEARLVAVLSEVSGQADADYLAQLYTQIARTYGLRADFSAAHQWLDRAEALCGEAEARGDDMGTARVRLLLERGRTFNSSGDPPRSVPLFESALSRAEAAGLEGYACDAAHMLGIVVPGEGGLAWNLRTITLAEAAHDPAARRWLGPLYNNTGWSLHDLGRFDDALLLFQKSLGFRREQGAVGQIRIAEWCVARCLRSLRRYDEALARQQALLAEFDAAGERDGYVHEELGELFLATARRDEARPHFRLAYTLLSQLTGLEQVDDARLARLKALGSGGSREP
jgi:tetratricopeptide (TPR) repeat protein